MNSLRINKILLNYGIYSRREVDHIIGDRKNFINGTIGEIVMNSNLDSDIFKIIDKKLRNPKIISEFILLIFP